MKYTCFLIIGLILKLTSSTKLQPQNEIIDLLKISKKYEENSNFLQRKLNEKSQVSTKGLDP